MRRLDEINTHPRDKHIRFQEEGHVYFVSENLGPSGQTADADDTYKSVTTFIHDLFPVFDADQVIDRMMRGRRWPDSKYFGKSRQEIKQGWEENAKAASEAGTRLHRDIESFYNGSDIRNSSQEWAHFLSFVQDHSQLIPYRTEWTLWDAESKICGSVDMLFANDDGTLSIYDWKRSKEIKTSNRFQKGVNKIVASIDDCNYEHYSLQLNIYKYLLEKNYGFEVSELAIVVFHPNNKTYRKYGVRDLGHLVEDLMQERIRNLEEVVEVTEIVHEGVTYLVDDRNNVIDESTGEAIGAFRGNRPILLDGHGGARLMKVNPPGYKRTPG